MNYIQDISFVFLPPYGEMILQGLVMTLAITAIVFVFGFIWAIILTGLRELPVRPIQFAVATIVEFHRNVPMVVQLFIWYFGVPQLLPIPVQRWINAQNSEVIFACIAIATAFGGYASEDLRSGIRAIDMRQKEAARALGLSYIGAMRWVIIPQAIRLALPSLMNQMTLFFQGTSLAMTIGVVELTYQTKAIADETYRIFGVFAVATVIYLAVSIVMMVTGERLRARNAKGGVRRDA